MVTRSQNGPKCHMVRGQAMNSRTSTAIRSSFLSVLAGLAVPAIAPTAVAAPIEIRTARVSVQDLDLTQADGMRKARDRLQQAARHLCLHVADPNDRSRERNFQRCVAAAIESALQQLPAPQSLAAKAR
jgi:UrcA family protein